MTGRGFKLRHMAESSRQTLALVLGRARQTTRLMCGVPDYEAYVSHMRALHPDRPIPTYENFFRDRQAARYDGRQARCC